MRETWVLMMDMDLSGTIVIDILRAFMTSLMLAYAAYQDVRLRRVSNKVWAVFAPIALVLLILEILFFRRDHYMVMLMTINVIMSFAIAFLAFYLGIIGGADAKAIMVLAVMIPRWPEYTLNPLEVVPPILDALITSAILALIYFPAIFIYNIIRGNLEIPWSFFGIKMYKDQAIEKKDYYIPLYKIEKRNSTECIEMKIRIILPSEEELDNIWSALEKSEMDKIWVSPGIPFMVYLFIGVIITLVYGDLLLGLILRV
ncbi:MAG: hypothetical protein DRN30_00410 [Thermoplasmata archaeon]|nr:MAG: hypothetical protein DRN30_00410 [Thermoplasmata archaeon]